MLLQAKRPKLSTADKKNIPLCRKTSKLELTHSEQRVPKTCSTIREEMNDTFSFISQIRATVVGRAKTVKRGKRERERRGVCVGGGEGSVFPEAVRSFAGCLKCPQAVSMLR